MNTDASKPDIHSVTTFGMPILLLLFLLAVLTAGLLTLIVESEDRVAREASKTIAGAAFELKAEPLANLARDYSWWNDAAENLVFELDPAWAADNLLWLTESFGVSEVLVFGPGDQPVYSTLGVPPPEADQAAWRDPGLLAVVKEARRQPATPEAVTTAYLSMAGGVHLVAASQLLQEADTTGHPPYPEKGVLVLTRRIDGTLIRSIQNAFRLPDLALVTDEPPAGDRPALPLRGLSGKPVAYATWTPPEPGTALLRRIAAPLTLLCALIIGVIALMIIRARRVSRALQAALDARLAALRELEHSARHDSLTDLPNRVLFLGHLNAAMAHRRRHGTSFTLHYLDLDGFKEVNDTHGHPAGDDLLRALAQRFREAIRATDTVARLGGDEFAVLQPGTRDPDSARLLAERLILAVAQPFELDGCRASVRLSVGIAFDIDTQEPEEIIRMADRALYRAKRAGGNRLEFYDAALDEHGCPSPGKRDLPTGESATRH